MSHRGGSEGSGALLIARLAVLGVFLSSAAVPARALDEREPWRIPADPATADTADTAGTADPAGRASDEFAWRLFVAINWPADPVTGEANRRATPGGDGPVVWERWANSSDVYRDDGADPGAWHVAAAPAVASSHRFESLSRDAFPRARHIVAGRMVALRDPLASARRLVEIRMNRLSADYIRAAGLYNLDGQMRKVVQGEPVAFPLGAIEVKASWRPIGRADRSRYHTLRVRFADGRTRLYGLNALNIAVKESPQWFWASFEHVDNATRVGTEGWQLPSRDRFACAGAQPDCNRVPAGIGVDTGVWQQYRLRGTMTRYVDAAGTAQRLGNSELESGLQDTASCMTCHARSALAVVAGRPLRLEIFDNRVAGERSPRRGYVGVPDPGWYHATAPDGQPLTYEPLDFVWSLAQARPSRDPSLRTASVHAATGTP
jgi:hypothetical protein